MPHVEVLGAIDLVDFHRRFAPRTWSDLEAVTRVSACYLGHDTRSCLVECQVIEGYLHQSFFVLLASRTDGVMVRLFSRPTPEKTHAVRRCLAWVARLLAEDLPQLDLGKTNLTVELTEPWPSP